MEKHSLKKLIIYSSVLLICAFLILAWDIYRLVKLPMISSGQPPQIIHIDNQTSARQFSKILKSKGLIRSSKLFQLLIRVQNLSHHLKAGIYKVYPGQSAEQFLFRVVNGDVLIETFSIIEGTTVTVLREKLKKAPFLNYHPSDWTQIAGQYSNAEGLLLADTYQYKAGSDSLSLLKQAHQNLVQYLNYSWDNRSKNLPYTSPYDLLIAASILEKEASNHTERELISGVMVNRLKSHMPLQMDPTVIYGLHGDYKGILSRSDLNIDSPYNTYKHRGLPPTPIAMTGKSAINAAAHPAPTAFLYFVAKGDGTHQFSKSYDQHRQAVSRYRKRVQ